MNELYYENDPSPRRRVMKNSLSKTSFSIKTKRNKSIDNRKKQKRDITPYGVIDEINTPTTKTKNKSKMNHSTALPKIGNWKGQFMSSKEYNRMISDEMTMIRKMKSKNSSLSNVMHVFKNNRSPSSGFTQNKALYLI